MHAYVGGHRVHTPEDFVELALGTPLELWLGSPDESDEECAARLDAARDILTENPDLPDRAVRAATRALEDAGIFNLIPLPPSGDARRFRSRTGAAA
ncbi:hypothetical protein ACIGW3_08610 [Streptomyces sp. NPDC053499]|uniref:hypothetical protein n=1 Tax=Streptomyces sp. NPDC053499 TaxID=3365707 RepID=UPI0037D8D58B